VEHIDWLTVAQEHPDAPDWGSCLDIRCDLETGDIETKTVFGDQVEGSWRSSLRVRCSAGRVEVSGNPSRWGRLEAVTGYGSLSECLSVYNRVLASVGLPPFDLGPVYSLRSDSDGSDHIDHGAQIIRVDLTRNLVLGSREAALRYLDALEGERWRQRLPLVRVADTTIRAGTRGKNAQLILYLKGDELLKHRDHWARVRDLQRESAVQYLRDLAEWCDSIGLVRKEFRLYGQSLKRLGCRSIGAWDMGTVQRLFDAQDQVGGGVRGALADYDGDIYAVLSAAGLTPRRCRELTNLAIAWLSGSDTRRGMSKPTWYRAAKVLREVVGIDIRTEPHVKRLAVIRPTEIQVRPLQAADLPVWYRFPDAA
jgi:hypothetical protein